MKTQSWQKWILILTALSFFTIILLLPLFTVFYSALEQGIGLFFAALKEPEALAAIWLTIKVSLIVLPINIFIGVVMAWAIAYFDFKGKSLFNRTTRSPLFHFTSGGRINVLTAVWVRWTLGRMAC